MMEEYKTKELNQRNKKSKKEVLPIFQKRQHWCFRFEGLYISFQLKQKQKLNIKRLNK
jgi:hypothetical protein